MIRKLNKVEDHDKSAIDDPIHERVEKAFLSYVSHRVRTPLNSIIGFSKLLMNSNSLDSSKKEEFIEMIMESGYELLHYFENILDASEMDVGMFSPNLRKVNISQIMIGVAGEYNDRGLLGKPVKVRFPDLNKNQEINVSTDEFILKRIVHNLIEIMIKNIGRGEINIFYSGDNDIIDIRIVGRSSYNSKAAGFVSEDLFSDTYSYQDDLDYLSVKVVKQMVNILNGELYVQNDINNDTSLCIVIPNRKKTDYNYEK